MRLHHVNLFLQRRFVLGTVDFDRCITAIRIEDHQPDPAAPYVLPGLVDIHTHGALGADCSDGDGAGLTTLARFYARNGTTTFLATTMTLPEKELTAAMHTIRDLHCSDGARCGGVHLEGPFLSYGKRGAQAAEHLHAPDLALFHRLNEASGGQVRMVTVACEEAGAMDFIRAVSRCCTVSLGHSSADYDTACRAFAHGASHVTHLFNGMPGLHHRSPGIIGAAMDWGATVELICNGLHVHPAAVRAAHRLFGDRLNLISDSLRCTGMADGSYTLGGQPIVMQHREARLTDGTLAGSSITLLEGVRRAVGFGIPLEKAVYAAAEAPARAAGLQDCGVIAVGRAADLVVLDQGLELKAVYLNGRLTP